MDRYLLLNHPLGWTLQLHVAVAVWLGTAFLIVAAAWLHPLALSAVPDVTAHVTVVAALTVAPAVVVLGLVTRARIRLPLAVKAQGWWIPLLLSVYVLAHVGLASAYVSILRARVMRLADPATLKADQLAVTSVRLPIGDSWNLTGDPVADSYQWATVRDSLRRAPYVDQVAPDSAARAINVIAKYSGVQASNVRYVALLNAATERLVEALNEASKAQRAVADSQVAAGSPTTRPTQLYSLRPELFPNWRTLDSALSWLDACARESCISMTANAELRESADAAPRLERMLQMLQPSASRDSAAALAIDRFRDLVNREQIIQATVRNTFSLAELNAMRLARAYASSTHIYNDGALVGALLLVVWIVYLAHASVLLQPLLTPRVWFAITPALLFLWTLPFLAAELLKWSIGESDAFRLWAVECVALFSLGAWFFRRRQTSDVGQSVLVAAALMAPAAFVPLSAVLIVTDHGLLGDHHGDVILLGIITVLLYLASLIPLQRFINNLSARPL